MAVQAPFTPKTTGVVAGVKRIISSIALLLAGVFAASSAPAHAFDAPGVVIDPGHQIRPVLLAQALNALAVTPGARKDVMAVVDFAKPSREPRFYVVDLKTGVVSAYRTAHGQGSDRGHDGMAELFSNLDGTHASSLGAYRTAKRYVGQHGLSLALDGLDKTNSNARTRLIVLHSAEYMTEAFVTKHQRPGRSWGCFVIDPAFVEDVVARLENGALLYASQ